MTGVALDSNILAYLAGVDRHPDDAAKVERVIEVVDRLVAAVPVVASAQAIGELYIVLRRNGDDALRAKQRIDLFETSFSIAHTKWSTLHGALELVIAHKLQFWDSVIVSAAAEAGCAMLLSEDMQSGFTWRGTTVINPLSSPIDRRLAALIGPR